MKKHRLQTVCINRLSQRTETTGGHCHAAPRGAAGQGDGTDSPARCPGSLCTAGARRAGSGRPCHSRHRSCRAETWSPLDSRVQTAPGGEAETRGWRRAGTSRSAHPGLEEARREGHVCVLASLAPRLVQTYFTGSLVLAKLGWPSCARLGLRTELGKEWDNRETLRGHSPLSLGSACLGDERKGLRRKD